MAVTSAKVGSFFTIRRARGDAEASVIVSGPGDVRLFLEYDRDVTGFTPTVAGVWTIYRPGRANQLVTVADPDRAGEVASAPRLEAG